MQALYWNYFKDSTEKHMAALLPRVCAQQRVKQSVLFVCLFACVPVRATRKHNESFEKLAPLCFETLKPRTFQNCTFIAHTYQPHP